MMKNVFWAIQMWSGHFYCGTYQTRVEAIAAHVDGLYRFLPVDSSARNLSKEQMEDWQRRYRAGDRAVRVEVRRFSK